jgi:phage major head subunit gpT-like protein
MAITRSAHPSALWPGIAAWFGNQYKDIAKPFEAYFQTETSDKAYEEVAEAYGFGLAAIKGEGQSIQYDTDGEGYKARFTNTVYGLGYIVTREAIEDNQYRQISERRSAELARSMAATKCIVHANVLNRGFAANGPDGVPLFSASHPTLSGNQGNLLTAADLSEAGLEAAATAIMTMRNARGIVINAKPKTLVIHPSEWANAMRILESDLQSGAKTDTTSTNNINALKVKGVVDQIVMDPYLTDQDAWFLTTDIPYGLLSFQRRAMEFRQDNDFDTENAKAKATERYSVGHADWRGVFGSAGA